MAEKPIFTTSELLTIYEIASRFDRSKPGYATIEDLKPLMDKVKQWFEQEAPGRTLR